MPTATLTRPISRLVDTDGRTLPLRDVQLTATAHGGRATVVLRQTFVNPHAEPLQVTYQVPLPADAAVGGFAFTLGDRRVIGEIDKLRRARERFEDAILAGRSASLLEQDRSSLFTQQLGNVPPGATIVAEITLDQPLAWRDGGWEWRFPTVVAPRYTNQATVDPERLAVDVAAGPIDARASVELTILDALAGVSTSPSHTIAAATDEGSTLVAVTEAALDRDVVVRWPVAGARPGVTADTTLHRGRGWGLLTVVPPELPGAAREAATMPRDLILLLDISGSMRGRPLDQARAVAAALVGSLRPVDQLEMIAFASRPTRWKARPTAATDGAREDALGWLSALRAHGGTEMHSGILAALEPLREGAQRQVILVTDGLIGQESQIVAEILHRLPAGSRVHTVGVGSGVNRSLTGPAARAGRGLEVVIGVDEAPHDAAARLLRRTSAPLVVDLQVSGSALVEVAMDRLPDLFAGAPARIPVELRPEGGLVVLQGTTPGGPWEATVSVPALSERDAGVARHVARERVEDLELQIAAGERQEVDARIEAIALAAGIASRLTAWIAVSSEATVDPTAPTRTETMPHALPHGMCAEGVGLRRAPAVAAGMAAMAPEMLGVAQRATTRSSRGRKRKQSPPPPAPRAADGRPGFLDRARRVFKRPAPPTEPARIVQRRDDRLVLERDTNRRRIWRLPATVVIVLANGERVTATVDTTSSTAAGTMARGATVRLVLRLDAPLAAEPTHIEMAPEVWTL